MSLASGTHLGPYEILSPLGAGGMGEVYRAKDTRLGREVAVKVLPAEYAQDAERLARFEREARAAAALNHPNILVLYDMGAHEGSPYLVTELLEGEPLRKRIAAGPLPVSKVVDYGAQVAEGLAAAHDKGIVHRDLKPENLFLTKDGRVKILDFGLARLTARESRGGVHTEMPTMDSPTGKGVVMGTVGYMAPEQIRGEETDARCDLFAFGCVLYEMVTGRKAFTGVTYTDIAASILKEEPPDLQTTGKPVPPGLERIIRRCIEKHPEQRFQSARDLAFGLQAFSGFTGTGAAPVVAGAAKKPGLWTLSPWVVLGALGALVLATVVTSLLVRKTAVSTSKLILRQVTFRRGGLDTARFSPDGKEILYSASWDGKPPEVFSARPGSPESRPLGFGTARLVSVFSNGDLLLRLANGALAQAPTNGGSPRELLKGAALADAGPDPQHICVVRVEAPVTRLEYPAGKVLVETRQTITWARISHRGDRVAFLRCAAAGGLQGDVMVVDASGKMITLSKGWFAVRGLAWSPGDGEVWFTGSRTGQNLAIYAVTAGGRERLVYRTPGQLLLQDISAEGKLLFNRQVTRYGIVAWNAKAAEERDLSWFDYSNLMDLSPDGSQVLFHEDGEAVGGKAVLYLRASDGSPPVRLGEGEGFDLTPDGDWVIGLAPGPEPRQLQAIPTGAGQPRALTSDALNHRWAQCMPDGKRFVFFGNEPGKRTRLWVQAVSGGSPQALTPEGDYVLSRVGVSPDGRELAYCDLQRGCVMLVSVAGGEPRPLPGDKMVARNIGFTSDGKSLLVNRGMRVLRVLVATGKADLVREIKPADPSGFDVVGSGIQTTADERAYAYQYLRELSDLFIAEGLK